MNRYYTKDEDKKIIYLREQEELKFKEIAKFLDRSVPSIRGRYAKIKGDKKVYYYGDFTELTKMEQAIYYDMCRNGIFDLKRLARKYGVSELTIKTHYNNIRAKKGVTKCAELVFDYWSNKQYEN